MEKTSNKANSDVGSNSLLEVIKALVVSVASTMLLILIFALCIKWFNLPEAAIVPVNQAIKAVSILVGALTCFKTGKAGWRKGLITGLFYVITTFILFSLLEGVFSFDKDLLVDIISGGIMGIICGIIAVNLRK